MAVPDELRQIVGKMPGLSKRERKIMYELMNMIFGFDHKVIRNRKDRPTFSIFPRDLVLPKQEKTLVGYNFKDDNYAVFPHNVLAKFNDLRNGIFFDIWDPESVRKFQEWLDSRLQSKDKALLLPTGQLLLVPPRIQKKFSFDETIIAIAAHEVRHRVIRYLGLVYPALYPAFFERLINEFVPKDDSALISYCYAMYHHVGSFNDDRSQELDPTMVAYWAVKISREKNDTEELVEKICHLIAVGPTADFC